LDARKITEELNDRAIKTSDRFESKYIIKAVENNGVSEDRKLRGEQSNVSNENNVYNTYMYTGMLGHIGVGIINLTCCPSLNCSFYIFLFCYSC